MNRVAFLPLLFASTLFVFACDGEKHGEGGESSSGATSTGAAEVFPMEFVDGNGQRFVWRRSVAWETGDPEEGNATPSAEEKAARAQEAAAKRAAMSVEEWAEALRAVTLRGGQEYIADPDMERAKRVHAAFTATQAGTQRPGAAPTAGSKTLNPLGGDPRRAHVLDVWGDERVAFRSPPPYPSSATLVMAAPTVDPGQIDDPSKISGKCSATLVGPSTAIMAAHSHIKDGNWREMKSWAIGASLLAKESRRREQVYPFGIHKCYYVYVSNAYIEASRSGKLDDDFWDFAAVEFSEACSDPVAREPGKYVGWLGMWDVPESWMAEVHEKRLDGYPVRGCPRVRGRPDPCMWPTPWWSIQVYPVAKRAEFPHLWSIRNALSPGQSGAAYYVNDGTFQYYAVGIATSDTYGPNGEPINHARRVDAGVIAFVQENTAL